VKKSDINNRKSMGKGYESFLKNLKEHIISKRLKTVLSANTTMIMLYWEIGKSILSRQQSEGWGAKIIDPLSHDREIVQRTVAQIPWRSNLTLLEKRGFVL
jgi:hypothetical protein